MAWTTILNSLLLIDKPWTSALATAFRDNLAAVAGGLAGAPRVQGVALGNVHLFSGQLSTAPVAFTGLDQVRDLVIVGTAQHDGSNAGTLAIGLSSDGGATWGASQTILNSGGVSDWVSATVTLNLTTGAGFLIGSGTVSGVPSPAAAAFTITVPTGVNAVRLLRAGGANTVFASLFVVGGNQ